jgi:putative Mg2+ transporter-C (MgtC) family protein
MPEPLIRIWSLPLGEVDFIWALAIAAILGALLGLERSVAGKHAGMRTYALVSLGSCLFAILGTLASMQLGGLFPGVNPLQLAGSIIIGVGFIGSGLSLLRGDHQIELTTATGIWVVAGVGMACGFGFYLLALAATAIALAIFTLFLRVENAVRTKYGTGAE